MKQAEFNNFITFKKVQIADNVFDINLGYYDDILLDFSQSLCVLLLDYMIICSSVVTICYILNMLV